MSTSRWQVVHLCQTDAGLTDVQLDERLREGLLDLSLVRVGRATPHDLEQLLADQVVSLDCIDAIEFDYSGPDDDKVRLDPTNIAIEIHPFSLYSEYAKPDDIAATDQHHSRLFALPNMAFRDLWTSLLFDNYVHARTLHSLVGVALAVGYAFPADARGDQGHTLRSANSRTDKDQARNGRSRVGLLYGSPGSGKSTTCRALAQKLSIRLAKLFPQALLVELHATTLFSKYFGESAQLVDEFFDQVEAFAKNPKRLVCVVIDEVDAIAGQRTAVQDDCRDDARATIALLTGLDRIRHCSNVIIFATSNIKDALDPAFVDRTDEALTIHIPLPSSKAIYEMLRRGIHELLEEDLIRGVNPWTAHDNPRLVEQKSLETWVPGWDTMMTHFSHLPSSIPCRLWRISEACVGQSARKVCVMPSMAFDSEYGAESTVESNVLAMEEMVRRKKLPAA